jgi:hypothetical protein
MKSTAIFKCPGKSDTYAEILEAFLKPNQTSMLLPCLLNNPGHSCRTKIHGWTCLDRVQA